jgi:hypothetical protein
MIHTTSLLEAHEQAAVLARRGYTVYIYRLPNGVYWMTLRTPHEVEAEFVERIAIGKTTARDEGRDRRQPGGMGELRR